MNLDGLTRDQLVADYSVLRLAGLAGLSLLWRGTVLDRAWTLHPSAYQQLSPLGGKI